MYFKNENKVSYQINTVIARVVGNVMYLDNYECKI